MTSVYFFSRINHPSTACGGPQGQMMLAVCHLVSSSWSRDEEDTGLIPQSLNLSAPHRELVKRGIHSYLLPGQEALHKSEIPAPAFEKHVSPEILKVCSVSSFCLFCLECTKCHTGLLCFTLWFSTGLQREACSSRGFHGLRCCVGGSH